MNEAVKQDIPALVPYDNTEDQRPIMIFYTKHFIETIVTSGELPEDVNNLLLQAIIDCKIFEEADLEPIIGYCHEPQNVLVTSVERMKGLFNQ